METSDFDYWISLWIHAGAIRPNGHIRWGDNILAGTIKVLTREDADREMKEVAAGVRRVEGLTDTLLSVEVVLQHMADGRILDSIRELPQTLEEFERFQAGR